MLVSNVKSKLQGVCTLNPRQVVLPVVDGFEIAPRRTRLDASVVYQHDTRHSLRDRSEVEVLQRISVGRNWEILRYIDARRRAETGWELLQTIVDAHEVEVVNQVRPECGSEVSHL